MNERALAPVIYPSEFEEALRASSIPKQLPMETGDNGAPKAPVKLKGKAKYSLSPSEHILANFISFDVHSIVLNYSIDKAVERFRFHIEKIGKSGLESSRFLTIEQTILAYISHSFCKARQFAKLSDFIVSCAKNGVLIQPMTFVTILVHTTKFGEKEDIISFFDKMPTIISSKPIAAYTVLLDYFASKKFPKIAATQLFARLAVESITPDLKAYNAYLNCFAVHGDFQSALNVFQTLKDQHLKPDEYTYSTLLKSLHKSNRKNTAILLFEEMKSNGIKPNLFVFQTLMDVLIWANDPDGVIKYFLEMQSFNIVPDAILFLSLIRVFSSNGLHEYALRTFEEMRTAKVSPPREYNFEEFFRSIITAGQSNFGLELLKHFREFQLIKNTEFYLHNLWLLFVPKTPKAEVMDILGFGDPERSLDMKLFNRVLLNLAKRFSYSNVSGFYFSMKQHPSFKPDEFTFRLVLDAVAKQQDSTGSVLILADMDRYKVKPQPYHFAIIINGCLRAGDLSEALSVIKRMKAKKLLPDPETYHKIIDFCGKNGEYAVGLMLFEEMKVSNLEIYPKTYVELIDSFQSELGRSGIVKLVLKLKVISAPLTTDGLNLVLKSLEGFDDFETAYEIFENAMRKGTRPDSVTLHSLVTLKVKENDPVGALWYFNRLKALGIKPFFDTRKLLNI